MSWRLMPAFVPIACLSMAACTTTTGGAPGFRTPIVAVAADDVGVVAALTPQAQGASLSVGYKGAKFAVLPVENARGELLGMVTDKGEQTYSIFTQLGLQAKGGTSRGVAVEQVLAIGPAADAWVKNASPTPKSGGQ